MRECGDMMTECECGRAYELDVDVSMDEGVNVNDTWMTK